jgi:hypothetical protein
VEADELLKGEEDGDGMIKYECNDTAFQDHFKQDRHN